MEPTETSTPIPATPTPINTLPAPSAAPRLFLSSNTNGTVNGIAFENEDVLLHNPANNSWELFFDGSDVGLEKADVTAFERLDDGSLLISLAAAIKLPGLGKVESNDILRFVPTSTGPDTAGSLELYFDGSDVDLSGRPESIDAIAFAPDGRLVISTKGKINVLDANGNKLKGVGADLFAFAPTSLGTDTRGSWSLYLSGASAGLTTTQENIAGAWIDQTGNRLYLSTSGKFQVAGLSGTKADVFICAASGSPVQCSFNLPLYWRGATFGFGKEKVDALAIWVE